MSTDILLRLEIPRVGSDLRPSLDTTAPAQTPPQRLQVAVFKAFALVRKENKGEVDWVAGEQLSGVGVWAAVLWSDL